MNRLQTYRGPSFFVGHMRDVLVCSTFCSINTHLLVLEQLWIEYQPCLPCEFKMNVGCHKFHEIKFLLFLRYYGINHVLLIYGSKTFIKNKKPHVVVDCISILCMCVMYYELMKLLWDYTASQWISQSVALVGQPTRIRCVWRIIIGDSTLVTCRLLIYDKHMVHENDLT